MSTSTMYEALNVHDDQFGLSDALMSIALALSAVAALITFAWMLYVGWAFSVGGFVMGIAGFLGWSLHIDLLSSLLG